MHITLCWLLCLCVGFASGLKIGAFNVKVFGNTKAGKPEVMSTLGKIIRRYDIAVIQEIRDSNLKASPKLLVEVNSVGPYTYEMMISDSLGRSTYKEQYAYFYRIGVGIDFVESYHYDDGDEISGIDTFMREPFVAHFRLDIAGAMDLVLIPIHTSPDFAVKEVTALEDVYKDAVAKWNIDNVLILGDFNADCSYVKVSDWPTIDLKNKPEYHWMIGDEADTTVSTNTDCAYDRIVAVGDALVSSITAGSAKVFRFDTEYSLTYQETQDVSDHYPVELEVN